MGKIVKRGPKAIRLQKEEWARYFCSVDADAALCASGVRNVFNLPDNVLKIWVVPFKRGAGTRAKITIGLGPAILIDGHDYSIDFDWVRVARRWIRQGYSYVGIEY